MYEFQVTPSGLLINNEDEYYAVNHLSSLQLIADDFLVRFDTHSIVFQRDDILTIAGQQPASTNLEVLAQLRRFFRLGDPENMGGAIRVDSQGSITYTAFAPDGSAENQPVWKIKKISEVGSITSITYPSGSSEYGFKWSDRLTYSYL